MEPRRKTSEPGETDGRRLRGERRRADIIAATLAVIERDGVAGVTHRTVAREAGVTPSSAVYYFATLDDLLVAALTTAVEEYVQRLEDIRDGGEDDLRSIAHVIAESSGSGRGRALAEHELTILAARRPALRPTARIWREKVAATARRHTDDPMTIQSVVAAADGVCARILLYEESLTVDEIHNVLRHALRPN